MAENDGVGVASLLPPLGSVVASSHSRSGLMHQQQSTDGSSDETCEERPSERGGKKYKRVEDDGLNGIDMCGNGRLDINDINDLELQALQSLQTIK